MTNFQPGWYPDPDNMNARRFWDGSRWGPSLPFGDGGSPADRPKPSPSGRHSIGDDDDPPVYTPTPAKPSDAPLTTTAPPGRKRRRTLIIAAAVVVVAAAAAVALVLTLRHSGGTKMVQVNGSISLTDSDGYTSNTGTEGETCFGDGGYDDIATGADVIISDDSGKTLAITHLASGMVGSDASCEFEFSTSVPAGRKYYGIEVTHRGVVKEQEKDLAFISLTLG